MLVAGRTSDKGMQRDMYSSANSENNSEASSSKPLQVLSSCEVGSKMQHLTFNGAEQSHSGKDVYSRHRGQKIELDSQKDQWGSILQSTNGKTGIAYDEYITDLL